MKKERVNVPECFVRTGVSPLALTRGAIFDPRQRSELCFLVLWERVLGEGLLSNPDSLGNEFRDYVVLFAGKGGCQLV